MLKAKAKSRGCPVHTVQDNECTLKLHVPWLSTVPQSLCEVYTGIYLQVEKIYYPMLGVRQHDMKCMQVFRSEPL